MTDHAISTGWHWEYGWLRRPEMDDANGYCYEEPDGDLVFTAHPRHKKAMRLTCWVDEASGEEYLAMNLVPCRRPKFAR